MKRPPFQHTIEGRVLIKAPVEKVYKFYRNFNNLPSFLGDVVAIDQTNGPSSRWTIQGPLGIHVHWTVRVTEDRANQLIKYETTGRPGPQTYWEIYFLPGSTARDTEVHEVMRTTLGTIGRAALALMGKFPGQEVAANLRRLKELMETGRVSDTSYAAKRKFGQRARNGNHRQDTLTNRVDWQRANEN